MRPWSRGETPSLAGPGLEGERLDLRSLAGRAVLVQFWASWCEPCRDELPALGRLADRMRGRPFALLTVNLGEGRDRAARFLAEAGVRLPVVLDPGGEAGRAWGVKGLPMAFLVDASGRVRSWIFGECDWTSGAPGEALEALVREAERLPGGKA